MSWRSVLLVEETGVPGENHRPAASPRIEINVSQETRDLLLFGWACRISENFNGKGPDFKEIAC
jgi:hypothetical protein